MSLLPVDEAVARILAGVVPLPAERVGLGEAYGRTLAEPLAAKRDQPPFDASAMDGYALRAVDGGAGARLKVIGASAAGHGFAGEVSAGEAVRIFTGAPLPKGADAVLIQEDAEAGSDGTVVAREAAVEGRHVRTAGFDFRAGDVLLAAGRVMGMRESALAAAMGHAGVPVRRRPRIAIIATGDELVPPSAVPGPDQIVGSNAFGLAAFARSVGAEPFDLGIVPDRLAAIGEAVERATALSADILVTLGGASVGDHDLVRQALSAKGMTLDFWRVAMRPGKPLMFGRLGAMRVVGLPGNPVSSLVCSLLFLKPLVAALLGQPEADPSLPAAAGADLPANDSVRQDYVRAVATIDDHGIARAIPMETQDSSALAALGTADCRPAPPPPPPPACAGDPCRIIRLP